MYPQNIKLTTDSLIFSKGNDHLQILLIQRGFDPFKGLWAFPGSYVEDYEDLEESALRELHEETGLKLIGMTQLRTVATPGRDPRSRTASVVYYAIINAKDHQVKGGDDAAAAKWINVNDITTLAFDHLDILRFALRDLQAELT